MTTGAIQTTGWVTAAVNVLLSIKPLAALAKHQAREMMIQRAERIGVLWRQQVAEYGMRRADLERSLAAVAQPIAYPDYYIRSFHAYEEGNLGWLPAMEVEVAAYAVHSRIWSKQSEADGDRRLRQAYHGALRSHLSQEPRRILDVGCSVGMSTFALQTEFPGAAVTGLDLSPYFLAIAHDRQQRVADAPQTITWVHAAAEATGLPDNYFDLVSVCLVCHELPQEATRQMLRELHRILAPGGTLSLMDMNPQSPIYARMPPYILTLLKSTEPYLDEYFSLDLGAELATAGFAPPETTSHTPRHRTVVTKKL
jgi:ubiquinone/menaquinone biosynthesis C-methylase UbiE